MAALIKKFLEGYDYVINDLADPRTANYPMISSPLPIILIIVVYNVFVQCVGPRWMKNRKPYNLKALIVSYDLLQVLLNSYLVFRTLKVTYWTGKYNVFCQAVETGTSPEELVILSSTYCYFLVKILDLVDTVFFLLSKKSTHVSFLHLYHHSGMVACGWIGFKYVPGGQSIFFGCMNGFVHALMYLYYLLSALKYLDSRHVFWKRSLTQLQMLQFTLIALHHLSVLLTPDCEYPRIISFLLLPQNTFIFILFADFYWKTYIRKEKST